MNDGAPALVDQIIAYESDMLGEDETIALFQRLVDNGMAWTLQGHYGRTATAMLRAGLISQSEGPFKVVADSAEG